MAILNKQDALRRFGDGSRFTYNQLKPIAGTVGIARNAARADMVRGILAHINGLSNLTDLTNIDDAILPVPPPAPNQPSLVLTEVSGNAGKLSIIVDSTATKTVIDRSENGTTWLTLGDLPTGATNFDVAFKKGANHFRATSENAHGKSVGSINIIIGSIPVASSEESAVKWIAESVVAITSATVIFLGEGALDIIGIFGLIAALIIIATPLIGNVFKRS